VSTDRVLFNEGGVLKKLMRWALPLVAVLGLGALLTGVATAQRAAPTHRAASIEACVLLPDTTSSTRYQLFDKPYLTKAFQAAGVSSLVLNAQGSDQTQKSQGDQCLTQGAKVILVDALDSPTGASIESAAEAKGVKTIDYDRLVLNGKASYYVSFNNVVVGKTMGKGLVNAIKKAGKYHSHPVIVELNGGITDNNATLFKNGYDSVLNPLYKKGVFKKGKAGDQWTDWNAQKGATIFEQMLAQNNNKINGAIAANDNLAGAVIADLKSHKLKPIALTGQDATPTGVQYILAGWQSGTVYKAVKAEAAAAAKAATQLIKGQKVTGVNGATNNKVRNVPSILLTPVWITKANYTLLFKDGFLKRAQVCVGVYKKYCK
jgi:D-xylose transport system substrate-binding protein